MDPQALAVLEESLKLWCHAGYTREEIKGIEAGVYIGAAASISLILKVLRIPATRSLRAGRII